MGEIGVWGWVGGEVCGWKGELKRDRVTVRCRIQGLGDKLNWKGENGRMTF